MLAVLKGPGFSRADFPPRKILGPLGPGGRV